MEDNPQLQSKIISITGTANKYQVKKLISENKNRYEKIKKKRVQTEKWTFSNEFYEQSSQLQLVIDLSNGSDINNVAKIVAQEINKKISGYKQQDKCKQLFNEANFLTFDSVLQKMLECNLQCRYCNETMHILYDIARESKQWTVDRIDNDLGHNIDNFHLACLDCNLKRRRRTDEKFLFTKQLHIVKQCVDIPDNDYCKE